ncbi:MAG: HAD hydrolase-like protein [Puniceicoccales bacterium]|jgi:HAD superfamily hydrolase (TIGR01450 family)|nr:HAD hydrolase-like protein [Puniceicoccales bacterium]
MSVGRLLLSYDVLLVDLYGVVWSGSNAFPEALDALQKLVAAGKEVAIVSNASILSSEIIGKYDAANLCKGIHFNHFVTSGDVLRDVLLSGNLPFAVNNNSMKYFVFGAPNSEVFTGSRLELTADLDEADFVYLSIPRFSDSERDEMDDKMKKFLFVARTNGVERRWDSTSIEPYIPWLRTFLKKDKMLVIANPDKFAVCQVLETQDSVAYTPKHVVKQGLIGEMYESMGGKIFVTGKPFPQIYRHALEKLAIATGVSTNEICQKRIAMVGDTLETDILGAKNANENIGCKIDGILVLSGISASEMAKNPRFNRMDGGMYQFFAEKKIEPTHVMSALDFDGEIYRY